MEILRPHNPIRKSPLKRTKVKEFIAQPTLSEPVQPPTVLEALTEGETTAAEKLVDFRNALKLKPLDSRISGPAETRGLEEKVNDILALTEDKGLSVAQAENAYSKAQALSENPETIQWIYIQLDYAKKRAARQEAERKEAEEAQKLLENAQRPWFRDGNVVFSIASMASAIMLVISTAKNAYDHYLTEPTPIVSTPRVSYQPEPRLAPETGPNMVPVRQPHTIPPPKPPVIVRGNEEYYKEQVRRATEDARRRAELEAGTVSPVPPAPIAPPVVRPSQPIPPIPQAPIVIPPPLNAPQRIERPSHQRPAAPIAPEAPARGSDMHYPGNRH